ncbi:MAG TPA: thiamine pyrophosphate-dependent enzyme, partial [Gemmatimonadaceae bacterium]
MTGLELLTAAREKLPVVVVVFNDGQLNLIRLQQLKEFGRASGVELLVPDFEQFAQAVGAHYRAATDDLAKTIAEALEQ